MRTIKIMSFAVLGALALSPAAFAQEPAPTPRPASASPSSAA